MFITFIGSGNEVLIVRSPPSGLTPISNFCLISKTTFDKHTEKDFVKDSGKLTFLDIGKSYEQMLIAERNWTDKIAKMDIPSKLSISYGFLNLISLIQWMICNPDQVHLKENQTRIGI